MATIDTGGYRAALRVVQAMVERGADAASFARAGVELLPRLVASEVTTLSVCDLVTGRRHVVAAPHEAIGASDRASFDRFFREHPLVRYHGVAHGRRVQRISDSVPFADFRRTALYNEYYRSVGLDHAVALPVHTDARLLVSFVLNRTRRDFSDRDRALLELTRTGLAALYRHATRPRWLQPPGGERRVDPSGDSPWPTAGADCGLTPREREVLQWVAAGKTDREIAAILGISPRTVGKHLQRVYVALGVETRTAAVMRAMTVPGGA